jgi:DNA-directed RNA polymerase specialized sigma subunit
MGKYEKTKMWLNRPFEISKQIDAEGERLVRLRSAAEMPQHGHDSLEHTQSNPDRMAIAVERVMHSEAKLDAMNKKYQATRREVGRAIKNCGDWKTQKIMTCRYLDYFSWAEIAQIMGYNDRWVYQMHNDALKKIRQLAAVQCS